MIRGNLTGERYNRILQRVKPRLRRAGYTNEEIDSIWYQHDNAPAHTANVNQVWLLREFGVNFIGRGSPFRWPARSSDLNPLDYFFWGKIKSAIYRHPVHNLEALELRIQEALTEITPEMLQASIDNLIVRAECCIAMNGEQFEHRL